MSETPLTTLDTYRLLGRSGLRVSPLCLGAMTFGTEWGWGSDEARSLAVLNAYEERGGNFIDTANVYTNGTSETMLGKFLKGRRDRFVLGTKYTFNIQPDEKHGSPNFGGNHRKSMMLSLERSLRLLQTGYVDLFWVHCWDMVTPLEEMMRAFDDMVRAGKVLYVAVSDFPAWKVSQANLLADLRGWSRFTAFQCEYNLVQRASERDIIPMCMDSGIAVTPWSPLASGLLTGRYTERDLEAVGKGGPSQSDGTRGSSVREDLTPEKIRVAQRVMKVAEEIGRKPAQVALQWCLRKPGITSVLLGARTREQLEENLGALDFTLGERHLQELEEVSAIDLGFPHTLYSTAFIRDYMLGKIRVGK